MKSYAEIEKWVELHPLDSEHVDCATAVMLKILDGKCKMNAQEKPVMAYLYHAVKHQPGIKLGDDMHRLIAEAEHHVDDAMRDAIYERRVLAETMISRPVMKAFKAMIRSQGIFDTADERDQQIATPKTASSTMLNLPGYQIRRQRL